MTLPVCMVPHVPRHTDGLFVNERASGPPRPRGTSPHKEAARDVILWQVLRRRYSVGP